MKIFSAKKAGALLLAMILAVSFSGVSAAAPGPGKMDETRKMSRDYPGKTDGRRDNRDRVPGQDTKQDRNDNRDYKPGQDRKDKGFYKGKPNGKNDKKRDNDKRYHNGNRRDNDKRYYNGNKHDDNKRPDDKRGGQNKKRDNGKKRGDHFGKNGKDRR